MHDDVVLRDTKENLRITVVDDVKEIVDSVLSKIEVNLLLKKEGVIVGLDVVYLKNSLVLGRGV